MPATKRLGSIAVKAVIILLLVRPVAGEDGIAGADPMSRIIDTSGFAAIALYVLNQWSAGARRSAEDMKALCDRLMTIVEKLSDKD